VVFLGDSVVRQSYHQFVSLVDYTYDPVSVVTFDKKHSDLSHVKVTAAGTVAVRFLWAPFVGNITRILSSSISSSSASSSSSSSSSSASDIILSADYVISGGGLWDALHERSKQAYEVELAGLSSAIAAARSKQMQANLLGSTTVGNSLSPQAGPVTATTRPVPVYAWLQPTTILDARLSPDKQPHMSEQTIALYRQAAADSLGSAVDVIIDATSASDTRGESSMDGIHFVDSVYQVVAQMVANAYGLRYPDRMTSPLPASAVGAGASSKTPKPYVPKQSGSMSSPVLGLGVLAVSAIMLYGLDNLLGLGYLSLSLCGRSADWDAAYNSLHKKLGVSAAGVSTGGQPAGASGADVSSTADSAAAASSAAAAATKESISV
jgi:hypothetical protein